MRSSQTIVPAVLLLAGAAQAAPIYSDSLVNFGATTGTAKNWPTVVGGTDTYYNWFGSASDAATVAAKALVSRTNTATDLTLSATFGGFTSTDRGNGVNYEYNGFTFFGHLNTSTQPSNPMQSYFADNLTASATRNGLTTFRFTAPEQYHFTFSLVGSYHNLTDGDPPTVQQTDGQIETLFNIGGVYTANKTNNTGSFSTPSVSYDPSGDGFYDRGGAVIEGDSVWDQTLGLYVLDLQMGVGSKGNLAVINAMRIQTSAIAIPEPAMAGVLLAAGGSLALRRRRSH